MGHSQGGSRLGGKQAQLTGNRDADVVYRDKEDNVRKQSSRWTVRDVITTVLLSVVMIVIQAALNVIFMFNNFASMVLSTGVIVLILGPVYALLITRVAKRGASLAYLTMVGMVYLASGNWYLLPWYVLVGLICEAILWRGGSCQDSRKVIAACTVSGFLHQGTNLLPIVLFWDTYYAFSTSAGQDPTYVNDYLLYYTNPAWLAFILALTLVCALAGGMIGGRLIQKHFQKAGVL